MHASNNPDADQPDERAHEQLDPHRTHPDELTLFDCHPTRFPGKWVAVLEDHLAKDQQNALQLAGYTYYRITLLPDSKAQVIIREDNRRDRPSDMAGLEHQPTQDRYDNFDPTTAPHLEDTDD